MTAERTPQEERSVFARPLRLATRAVLRFPAGVAAVAVAAALLAVALGGTRLGFRTSRLDLLNPESGYNRLWIDYINEFGDEDDVVVVVEGASREEVVPVLEEISAALVRHDRLFHAVLHEVDLSKIRSKGLHYLQTEELAAIEQFLAKAEPIVRGEWSRLNLSNVAGGIAARLAAAEGPHAQAMQHAALGELSRLSEGLLAALGGQGRYQSPWPEMPGSISTLSELNSEYLLTNEGRLGFVLLRLAKGKKEGFTQGTEAIDALRRLIAQAQAAYPDTKIGLTGLPVMENDEMRSSQRSMTEASLLSLLGVVCLFIAGFGGLRHPLMTVLALLAAMGWSLGYITLAIGHLNILSISFGVILIGLGIDFGVHYVARYLQLRRASSCSCDAALLDTASGVGPGVVTGAITTAIAFFVAGLTDFTGVAELGVIAGGGIVLCCLAALFVLPALIHLSDHNKAGRALPAPLDVFACLQPLLGRPRTVLAASLALTAVLSLGMTRLWYDHNLLNLQPEGIESVELERKLLSESDQSVWFALSIAESSEELLRRKALFLEKPSVLRTEEIASLFPLDEDVKRPVIERIHGRLADLPERPPRIAVDSPADFGLILAQIQAMLAGNPQAARVERQLAQARDAMRQMPLSECYRLLSDYQQRMAGDLLSRMHTLRTISNPEAPQLTDLPEGLVTRFVGQGGRYLLKIYSKGNIWDMDAMEQFVHDVRSVDPRATGNPLQTYEASRAMKRSFEKAGWYALVGIVCVLLIDFGRFPFWLPAMVPLGAAVLQMFGLLPWHLPYWMYLTAGLAGAVLFDLAGFYSTVMAMVPLGLGMLQMFGVLGLLDIPLNPANMIVLPLILGIGIDNGVHVMHDFRRQDGRYRMSASTASSVLITSLTSMVGFGSLMIAAHQGLQSLGRVLTIGISCCLFSSLVVLPSILAWITRGREEESAEEVCQSESILPMRRVVRRDAAEYPGTSPQAADRASHRGQSAGKAA
jgi:uncharacterized protein